MVKLQQIQCTSCGAPIEWDGTYGKPVTCSYCGSVFMPGVTGMEDVWLMTDRVARARYEFKGTLDKLEQDIRFEVMRGQDWSALDRAYLGEINRLVEEGVVRQLATFWAVSPHPPIYRALQNGELNLKGNKIPFKKGDEIMWACPMTRDRFDLELPVLTGDFQNQRIQQLCGEMANAMMGRMQ